MSTILSRRTVLTLGTVGMVGALVSACGSEPALNQPLQSKYDGDAAVAAHLFQLEATLLAATAAVTDAAVSGRLATVPPALTAALGVAGNHHGQHLARWKTALTAAGFAPPSGLLLAPQLGSLREAATVPAALLLLAEIQQAAVSTYLASVAQAEDASTRALLAAIGPVEAEHGATWDLLGGVMFESDMPTVSGAIPLPTPSATPS